jgi:hypothetical protein
MTTVDFAALACDRFALKERPEVLKIPHSGAYHLSDSRTFLFARFISVSVFRRALCQIFHYVR